MGEQTGESLGEFVLLLLEADGADNFEDLVREIRVVDALQRRVEAQLLRHRQSEIFLSKTSTDRSKRTLC